MLAGLIVAAVLATTPQPSAEATTSPAGGGEEAAARATALKELAQTSWTKPALFSAEQVKWKEGKGTFEGLSYAIMGEDSATGSQAMLVKLPPNKTFESRPHWHPATSHTVVLEGTVTVGLENGKIITLKPGDYFRTPARWVHTGSGGGDPGPVIFMMTVGGRGLTKAMQAGEPSFDTIFAKPAK